MPKALEKNIEWIALGLGILWLGYVVWAYVLIRVFVGGTRGGLKCISGVCRDFPAFTGGRLEVVVRL